MKHSKIIQTMKDLDTILSKGKVPISFTPPYFAESENYDNISIITGSPKTFDFDLKKEPDNPWNSTLETLREEQPDVFPLVSTKKKLRKRTKYELNQLQKQFANAGFDNFYYLPANVPGMISWIFINNAMAASFDSKGRPLLYFGKMKNLVRVPEPSLVEYYLTNHSANLINGFEIGHAINYTMEGKGDQLPMSLPLIIDGKQSKDQFYHMIINCSGRRTNTNALEEYADFSRNYVIEIPLSSHSETGAYHGNVAILYYQNMDGDRGVVYVPDMLQSNKRRFVEYMFETFFGQEHVHQITSSNKFLYEEAIKKLSMNAISVGHGRMICSSNNPWTNAYLKDKVGLELLEIDMKAIALGGGGLQCCYTALNKTPLNIK